jgi:cytochrome P450
MRLVEAQATMAARAKGARLAPGRLEIPDQQTLLDQQFLLKRAEQLGPVFKVWVPNKMTTCIVGHAAARRFLVENEGKTRAATTDLSPLFPFGFLRALEGPTHRHYRRLILEAFRQTPLEPHIDAIRENIRSALESLARAPQPVASPVIRRALKAATTANFMQLILGVRPDSPRYSELTNAYDIYAPDGPFIVVRPRHKPAFAQIHALVTQQVEAIKSDKDAKPSLLRHLIRSDTLDETTLGNLIQMVEATRYDLHGLWTWLIKMMSDQPEIAERVRTNPAPAATEFTIAESVAREALRLEQSELLHRVPTDNLIFDGYYIPKDTRVRICVWEAHHDPKKFADPFRFDCERFMRSKVPADDYSPFGLDKHHCLGADWTYSLSAVFVEELARGYRWDLITDGPPVSGKFHFEPSPSLSIDLQKFEASAAAE